MSHCRGGRPVDRFSARTLAHLLELRQWAGVHGETLRSSEIADWLGQARQTVTRWRREHPDFPPPAGTCRVPRMKGKGIAYCWRPQDVLQWRGRTGRLVA